MVVTHKNFKEITSLPYQTIIVGNGAVDLKNAWHDNINDNISDKNQYYCELTALYWVWKNKSTLYDAIGLCHYRRLFTKRRLSIKKQFFLSNNDISQILNQYDVILPEKFYWTTTVAKMYFEIGGGYQKDLDLTKDAIHKLFPDYLPVFQKILDGYCASYCNMFIMSSENMNRYCEWLFNILEYVESKIDISGYTVQEKRVFGYLAEILMNVWIEKNNLKVKYYPVANLELPLNKRLFSYFRNLYGKLKLKVNFRIKCN